MFISPNPGDLELTQAILQKFGHASGLHVNMAKSSIIPIRCEDAAMQQVQSMLGCQVSSFPCRYLGLPLSIHRLTAADLQPFIDKIADKLPG